MPGKRGRSREEHKALQWIIIGRSVRPEKAGPGPSRPGPQQKNRISQCEDP